MPEHGSGELLHLNDVDLYVEIHGSGRPLVLLHGGLMSCESFDALLPALLDAGRQVILPDLQGHGRTPDNDRPIDPAVMAGDIAALIDHLGPEKPDLVGYSLGGGVAWHVGFKWPEKVRRLVPISVNISRRAVYPDMLAQQSQVSAAAVPFMMETPMWQLYQRVAPDPAHFPDLLDKIGASMSRDFDFSDQVEAIQVPTMVVAADADMAPPSHFVDIFGLLDGGRRDGGWGGEGRPRGGHALAIVPGATHYSICESPLLAPIILGFLGGE